MIAPKLSFGFSSAAVWVVVKDGLLIRGEIKVYGVVVISRKDFAGRSMSDVAASLVI